MSHGPAESSVGECAPWYRELTGYHWFVFIVCTLSWMFDCLDQRFFVLAAVVRWRSLLGGPERGEVVRVGGDGTAADRLGHGRD